MPTTTLTAELVRRFIAAQSSLMSGYLSGQLGAGRLNIVIDCTEKRITIHHCHHAWAKLTRQHLAHCYKLPESLAGFRLEIR